MDDIAAGYVAVGLILSPWGARGDLKVDPLADEHYLSPGRSLLVAGQTHTVERSRLHGRLLHVKLSGIDDRTAAKPLGQHYLQVPEGELEPLEDDRYYRFQLIGLSVRSDSGEPLGRIIGVDTTPSNDLFVVQGPRGEILVPAIDDIVKAIDVRGGVMTIEVVPGLIPPERNDRRRR